MMTIEEMKSLCEEYCGKCGVIFNGRISINPQLKHALGRCFLQRIGTVYNPLRIEISKSLLETATVESIKAVIGHECAHYAVAAITHERHGHDDVFRHYCKIIGTESNGFAYNDIKRTVPDEKIYKYTIYCSECGRLLGGRHRACKMTKFPELYTSNCCDAEIIIQNNW